MPDKIRKKLFLPVLFHNWLWFWFILVTFTKIKFNSYPAKNGTTEDAGISRFGGPSATNYYKYLEIVRRQNQNKNSNGITTLQSYSLRR